MEDDPHDEETFRCNFSSSSLLSENPIAVFQWRDTILFELNTIQNLALCGFAPFAPYVSVIRYLSWFEPFYSNFSDVLSSLLEKGFRKRYSKMAFA